MIRSRLNNIFDMLVVGHRTKIEVKTFQYAIQEKKCGNQFSRYCRCQKKYDPPCQGISSVIYTLDSYPGTSMIDISSLVSLLISYTDKFKIITQSQKIDFQALIGYIGGYVGLFLGINRNK